MIIIGFSRGGTHLFWRIIASTLNSTQTKEINDHVGLNTLGLKKKILLELQCIIKLSLTQKNVLELPSNSVEKMVCSWSPNFIFRLLRRNDPTKYLFLKELRNRTLIILVKSPEEQIKSWMDRGCSFTEANFSYQKHIENWKKLSNKKVFVRYSDFIIKPEETIISIFNKLNIQYTRPKYVKYSPKKYKGNSNLPEANSKDRKYIKLSFEDFILHIDPIKVNSMQVHSYSKDIYENLDFISVS